MGRRVVGYAAPWTARPGERVCFRLGADGGEASCVVDVVRLRSAVSGAEPGGLVEEVVESSVAGVHRIGVQRLDRGSRIVVPADPRLAGLESFTLQVWLCPTRPGERAQAVMGTWDAARREGFGLFLGEGAEVGLVLGDGQGKVRELRTGVPLRAGEWVRVDASYDAASGVARLAQTPRASGAGEAFSMRAADRRERIGRVEHGREARPLVFAAWRDGEDARGSIHAAHLDGKLEAPRLARRVLTAEECEALDAVEPPMALGDALVGHWDLGLEPQARRVVDRSPLGLHGRCENLPTRAVTGRRWDGTQHDWRHTPDHYGAIHFHTDDLYEAGWDVAFELEVPAAWPSGIYAARVQCGEDVDHVPFFVCPERGEARSDVAFLVPTATHIAYANLPGPHGYSAKMAGRDVDLDAELYAAADRFGGGCYHVHADGSGMVHSSALRPILTLRPQPDLWGFNADVAILEWLEEQGAEPDVLTDELLHAEGVTLLEGHRVLVTGSHPEYYTTQMLDAIEAFLRRGGRLIYMGGNGFYWRIAFSSAWPGAIELRRAEDGTRTWASPPGEYHHAWSGELGGLWRRIGRPPNRLVGVGFTAQGFLQGRPYRIAPGARRGRAAFAFEGLAGDEIGRSGPLGGAAGEEIDRIDFALGTPSHALVLATASGFGEDVLKTKEEFLMSLPHDPSDPDVRADAVFFETPAGGAVFSTGSIAWASCLSAVEDDSVSRLTANVLRRFRDPAPFEVPGSERADE